MSLSTSYKEYILEKLHKEYLSEGVIPTSDQLDADLVVYQKTHPDLSLPKSKYIDFSVERGGESSAAKVADIANTISDDVSVIIREIYDIAIKASSLYERWAFESSRLVAKAKKLEHRVDSLLLLANNIEGYFATVGDSFVDLNKVDTTETTAEVNIKEQCVSISTDSSDTSNVNQIDTTSIRETDVSFIAVSGKQGTSVFDIGTNNNLSEIFKTENSTWDGRITTPNNNNGSMVAELKAKISDSYESITKIALEYCGPTTSTKSTVSLMYSLDGYSWALVPTNDATKQLVPYMSWMFPAVDMKYIKFIFYKPVSDGDTNGRYEYNYSIKHVSLCNVSYSEDFGNTFVSDSLSAINASNETVGFSMIKLDVCEKLPANTNIDYFVSASKDDSQWSDWISISPSGQSNTKYPKIINLSGIDWIDNTDSSSVTLFNSAATSSTKQMEITTLFDLSGTSYRFKSSSFGVINTVVPVILGYDQNAVSNTVRVWRNTRYRSAYPDTLTVRDVARGWGLDGKKYSCYFEIINPSGKVFDFGTTSCTIDGSTVSGVIVVPMGIHKFETINNNWYDISSVVPATINNESELKTYDPLYPYNHKLMIEGIPYPNGFVGNKIYMGTDISAQYYSTKCSLFNLESEPKSYELFAVRGVGSYVDTSQYTALGVIVGYNPYNSDYTNELFLVQWRGGDNSDIYKYVKLKAILETDAAEETPNLTAYRLMLGL